VRPAAGFCDRERDCLASRNTAPLGDDTEFLPAAARYQNGNRRVTVSLDMDQHCPAVAAAVFCDDRKHWDAVGVKKSFCVFMQSGM
jgi:hypothetical protein